MNFMIVKSLSRYNGIIGRPGIREIQAVPSTAYEMLKFLVDGGIVTICSTILIPAECAMVTTSSNKILREAEVCHEKLKVALHSNFPDQEVEIGGTLSAKGRTELCSLLKENLDIFAWQPADMTGVPRSVAEHRLNIREGYSPVRQKKRGQAPEREVEGMFLGYMISLEGIKPCLDKIEVVLQLPSLWTIKEIQRLNGKLASLNRFLSKSVEKSLQLFKTLKKCIKKSDFHLTPEAEQAFKQLKQHLSELPLLVAPKPKKELIVYMSASHKAISAVLMIERGTVQTPVYFVSRALQGPELNYTPMEKLVLSLVFATKRLRRYFQAHPIAILADFLIEKPDEAPPDTSVVEILTSPEGTEFTYALRFQFTTSNNEAKYEALISGLRIAAHMGVRNVHVSVDSILVANQVLGTYVAKEENMVKYLEKAKSRISGFANLNKPILKEKSIQEEEVDTVVEEEGPTWMTPIIEYLKDGTLPDDRKEASKLCIKAKQYELLEGVLYRRSFLKPWLRCVGPLQADYVIREIHEGSCSMHAGPRNPQQPLTPITAPWPFYKWGIDIAGPFPEGPGKVKFLIVAMDYFTKWIEAKAVATITGNQVKKFVWDNIVCRFGLPGEIVSDNGKQFSDNPFKDWCEKLNITQRFASVKHPQSNGLVERANRSLGEGIKARLGEGNKNWIEELPHVLWAHRTMIKSSHGDTPFSLTYGTEAVIPAEIRMPTYRTAVVDAVHNNEELRLNLDLLEERRERAAIREARTKLKMTKYYNARVRGVTFRPRDFFYRSNEASHAMDGGKLGPKWEGPYEVTEALGD
ncbi:reverse transcriptase domain-containing protein [Tanacetum coccineum]